MTTGEYDKSINHHQKHNLVFSLKDGLLTYYHFDTNEKVNKCIPYPIFGKTNLKNGFIVAKEDDHDHFKFLAQYIFMGTSSSSIIFPDMAHYMNPLKGGELKQEK